jgi:hypothetical protein
MREGGYFRPGPLAPQECCRAISGHAAAAPLSSDLNPRRLTRSAHSARASSVGGMSMPSAFAVCMLMMKAKPGQQQLD